jgi:ornithine lipid hydroxylase
MDLGEPAMGRGVRPWLWLLAVLYLLRVLAQAVQAVAPVGWLPPYEAWQGSGLPYGILLLAQVEFLIAIAAGLWAVHADAIQPAAWARRCCLIAGVAYFTAMALRLVLGLTLFSDVTWFAATLPTLGHLAMAGFLIVFGLYLRRRAREPWQSHDRWQRLLERASYPVVMAVSFAYFPALMQMGLPISVSAYGAAAIGACLVLLHERVLPHRQDWRSTGAHVRTDATYFALVQVGVPTFLSVTLVVLLAEALQDAGIVVDGLWPHDWPFLAQVVLMVLAADFFRYWLHRAMHEVPLLWQLHAVHHSPKQLYALNVGRFHPLEKFAQYFADVLPFALIGVMPEVLAGRIVLYGANGFYQHCNCRIRLGWLNYVAAGPELHRWHHSKRPGEANSNYGNNVIVWDLLFRTWFLPKERAVEKLGLKNRQYPTSFLGQLKAPFVRGLEGSEGRG